MGEDLYDKSNSRMVIKMTCKSATVEFDTKIQRDVNESFSQ